MTAATKLALALLALWAVGLALIVAGVWPHYRIAAVTGGIVLASGSAGMFAALWRARP